MQTRTAAKNITKPTVPFRMPPTKGIKPKIVVIGEKNMQIPDTIKMKEPILMSRVQSFDFSTAFSTIWLLVRVYSSTIFIYSIGFKRTAMQFERQQHAGSQFFSTFPFPSYYAMGKDQNEFPTVLAINEIGPHGQYEYLILKAPWSEIELLC